MEEENGEHQKNQRYGIKFWIRLLIAAVMIAIVIWSILYFTLVYSSKRVILNVADVYTDGTGEELAELIAPGYAAYFEETYSYASFVQLQQQYIDSFRGELAPYVGELQEIDVEIEALITISNPSDFTESFEMVGIQGVSQYKQIEMVWHVTGTEGSKDICAQAFVLKCDDGWFLDSVTFAYE